MGRTLEWRDGLWRVIDEGIKKKKPEKSAVPSVANEPEQPEHYPFTRWVTFGNHLYRQRGDREDVAFVNEKNGHRKVIVDHDGSIRNFPGIVEEDFWMKELTSRCRLAPVVRFRTVFEVYDEERYRMIWEIQPDGRYWEDEDGFGAENDLEIRLYALLDLDGNFMGPFRVYNVGREKYFK